MHFKITLFFIFLILLFPQTTLSVGVLSLSRNTLNFYVGEKPLALDPSIEVSYDTSIDPPYLYKAGVGADTTTYNKEKAGTWPGGSIIVTLDDVANDNFRDILSCTPSVDTITSTYDINTKTLTLTTTTATTIADIQATLRTLSFYTAGTRPGSRLIRLWILPLNYSFVDNFNGRVIAMFYSTRTTPSGANVNGAALTFPQVRARVANEPLNWGLKAYFMSIRSAEEQVALHAIHSGGGWGSWIGATYDVSYDGWIWVDGPDAGVKIFNKRIRSDSGSGPTAGVYTNFYSTMPDGNLVGGGLNVQKNTYNNQWDDSNGTFSGYFFKYGGHSLDENFFTVMVHVPNALKLPQPY